MPRSGVNGTYTLPPNTDNQQPLTPISSSMFNAAMDDVEQTFNSVQPVAYGGTGASDAAGARAMLGAASIGANTFTGPQKLPTNSRITVTGGTGAYLGFEKADGSRTGYVGNGTTANDDVYLTSDIGNVRLSSPPGFNVIVSGSRIVDMIAGVGSADAANVGQIPAIVRSIILGNVGFSGSVPNGGIFEYGNNANGHYLKYADGTMDCWGEAQGLTGPSIGSSYGTTAGNIFYENKAVPMPAAFINTGYAVNGIATLRGRVAIGWASSTSTATIQVFNNVTDSVIPFTWTAKGRWRV